MSYCVNCGVELEERVACCPLCGVKVVNPARPRSDDPPVYSVDRQPLPDHFNRQFAAELLTIACTLPLAVCVIVNLAYNPHVLWSAYVAGALFMLWVAVAPPLLMDRRFTFLFILFDGAAVGLYLTLIDLLVPQGGWLLPLALPITAIACLLALGWLLCSRLKGWYAACADCVLLSLALLAVEGVISGYVQSSVSFSWSLVTAAALAPLGILFFIIQKNTRLREKARRRMHL